MKSPLLAIHLISIDAEGYESEEEEQTEEKQEAKEETSTDVKQEEKARNRKKHQLISE